ncbi:hypothetical protein ACWGLF_45010 [Streptomyces puniciscabiei]
MHPPRSVARALTWTDDGTLALAPRIGAAGDQARIKGMTIPSEIAHGNSDAVAPTCP